MLVLWKLKKLNITLPCLAIRAIRALHYAATLHHFVDVANVNKDALPPQAICTHARATVPQLSRMGLLFRIIS